jgi:hypothetical protein
MIQKGNEMSIRDKIDGYLDESSGPDWAETIEVIYETLKNTKPGGGAKVRMSDSLKQAQLNGRIAFQVMKGSKFHIFEVRLVKMG